MIFILTSMGRKKILKVPVGRAAVSMKVGFLGIDYAVNVLGILAEWVHLLTRRFGLLVKANSEVSVLYGRNESSSLFMYRNPCDLAKIVTCPPLMSVMRCADALVWVWESSLRYGYDSLVIIFTVTRAQ